VGTHTSYEIVEKEIDTGRTISVVSGTGIITNTHFPGEKIEVTATPEPGQTFIGWFRDGELVSTEVTFIFTVPDRNVTLESRYEVTQHIFNITARDGGTVSGGGSHKHSERVTLVATPNDGYVFDGWFAGNTRVSSETTHIIMAEGAVTLEARFSLITYTVNLTRNPTAGGTVTGGGTFDHGTRITVTATVAAGHTFDGWYNGSTRVSTQASYSFNVEENTTLEARFNLPSRIITVNRTPTVGGTVTGGGTVNHGANVTITATPSIGYAFVGWYISGRLESSLRTKSVNATSNMTIEARFVRLGSISGDGNVTIGDALEILKYLAKLPSAVSPANPVAWSAARITAPEGTPTIGDALEILKYLAKLPSMVI
jgi:uncharacterized repeat protein (TIGR02543 family)